MFRTAVVLTALLVSPAALACPGKSCCDKEAKAPVTEHAADAVEAAQGTKLALSVSGMTCGACAAKITASLEGLDGVNAVIVDATAGTARIAYDAEKLDEAKLIATIAAAGDYTATVPTDDQG